MNLVVHMPTDHIEIVVDNRGMLVASFKSYLLAM